MYIADKMTLAKEYFAEASKKKDHIDMIKKHEEKRVRDFAEEDKTRTHRKFVMDEHEKSKQLNFAAREKEIGQHLQFIKSTTAALNII